MKRIRSALVAAIAALCTLGLAGCVSLAPEEGGVLTSRPAQRYSDGVIQPDWRNIEELTARLTARARGMDAYAAYKAQFLIEIAIDEYHENDRSGVIQWALGTARDLIEAPGVQAQRKLALDVPPPGRHDSIGLLILNAQDREVLISAQNQPGALPCAAEAMARYFAGVVWLAHDRWEVMTGLVKPGHEHEAIERLAERHRSLETALAQLPRDCMPQINLPAPLQSSPPALASAALPLDFQMSRENLLFSFDGYSRTDLLPDAAYKLADVAFRWLQDVKARNARGSAAATTMMVVAHADRIGSASYNRRLAWRRAETVKMLLVERGVPAEDIEIRSMGSERPVTRGCTSSRINGQLIACLAPDRRVEILTPSLARPASVSGSGR